MPGGRLSTREADEKQRAIAERQLRKQVIMGMSKITDNYDELVDLALDIARDGSRQMIIDLLKLPFSVMDMVEKGISPFQGMQEKWVYERTQNGPSQEAEDSGPTISAEHHLIE